MCDPMTTAVVISAAGTVASGMAQSAVSNYNSKVATINADAAAQEGIANAGNTRAQFNEVASAQTAALAKAGVNLSSGSAERLAMENQRRQEYSAEMDIWRGRTQQTAYLNQAGQFRAEGSAAKTAAFIRAGTTLIGGFAKAPAQPGTPGAGSLGVATNVKPYTGLLGHV